MFFFCSLTNATGYQFDYVFDWTVLKHPQTGSSSSSSSRTRVISPFINEFWFGLAGLKLFG